MDARARARVGWTWSIVILVLLPSDLADARVPRGSTPREAEHRVRLAVAPAVAVEPTLDPVKLAPALPPTLPFVEARLRDLAADVAELEARSAAPAGIDARLVEMNQLLAVALDPRTDQPHTFLAALAASYGAARAAVDEARLESAEPSPTHVEVMTRQRFEALAAAGTAPSLPAGVADRLPSGPALPVAAKTMRSVWDAPHRGEDSTAFVGGADAPPARVNAGWIAQQFVTDAAMPAPLTTAQREAVPTVATDGFDALYVVMLWQHSSSAISGGFHDGLLVFQSIDDGETWQWSAYLYNTNSPVRSISWPHMAIDPGQNRVYVVYESEDWNTTPAYVNEGIYLLWYDPYVGTLGNAPIQSSLTTDDVYPVAAAEFLYSPNYVGVVFQTNGGAGGSDIRYTRSIDRGATWSAPVDVMATPDAEGLPWITAGSPAGGGSAMTIAYQAAADPFGNDLSYLGDEVWTVTAADGDPAAFAANPKTRVLAASAFEWSDNHDAGVAHAHGSGDVVAVAEVNRSFHDDIEGSTASWINDGTWSTVVNGTTTWFSDDVPFIRDSRLQTPAVTLSRSSKLVFNQSFNLEYLFDGAVVEISTNGGGSWIDLRTRITSFPYTTTLSASYGNPLGGRYAWTGTTNGAFGTVIVDLTPYQGATARFRFRLGTDNGFTAPEPNGWWIDDVYVTNVGNGHNVANGWSLDDGATWSGNWWFPTSDIERFPAISSDGMGRTSSNAAWSGFHLAFLHSASSPSAGTVRYLWADANTTLTTWYQLTASPEASDDALAVAQSQCLSVTSQRVGVPCLAWMRNGLDVYFTTLGDNYQFDTKRSGGHIALSVDVDGSPAPTVDYEAWPFAVGHTVLAPSSGDLGAYHYGFVDWTWAGGSQAARSLAITSDYADGVNPPPVVAFDANYFRCTIAQPSLGNTLLGIKSGVLPSYSWTDPGGERQGFRVYRASSPGPPATFTAVADTPATGWTDGAGGGASDFYYRVVSYCGDPPDTHEGP